MHDHDNQTEPTVTNVVSDPLRVVAPRDAIDPMDVLACVRSGMTARQAADHLGYSLWSVRDVARQIGTPFKDPRRFTPEERARAVELRRKGLSLDVIGKTMGRSNQGVRKVLIDEGEYDA